MSNIPILIAFVLAGLLIILGFVALLTQKIYLDQETKTPIEFDIPLLGKMKANKPAIVFVVLGVYLAIYALSKSDPPMDRWSVNGTMMTNGEKIDWRDGNLTLFPTNAAVKIFNSGASEKSKLGRFEIAIDIEKGKTFEDVIQRIDYSHSRGSFQILPKKEFEPKNPEQKSTLKNITVTSREYDKLALTLFPSGGEGRP
jgi:hypothetical protein